MTYSPADVVRYLMVQVGLGVLPAGRAAGTPWPVCVGLEPNEPDDCIPLKDTAGRPDGRLMVDGRLVAHYGVQARVRATDERTGWLKADEVRTTLAALYRVYVGALDATVHALTGIGQVLPLGKETPSSKRQLFTLNFMAALPLSTDSGALLLEGGGAILLEP